MRKGFLFFLIVIAWTASGLAAKRALPDKFINKTLYENVYPSTLNQSKDGNGMPIVQSAKNTQKTTNTTSNTPVGKRSINKRTTNARSATKSPQTTPAVKTPATTSSTRRVVPRTNTTTVRSATKTTATQKQSNNRNISNRKVVARAAQGTNTARTARLVRNTTSTTSSQSATSSQRCFADYKSCMDSYCERSDTAYSRCFCSAKLAQIDSKYQNKIDSLVQEIIKLKYNTDATDAEIKQYWDETVGVYTGTNPWVNIDNALNIDWADTQTRFRGQNAFTAGHTYCVNHLHACSYMASNLRDAYKSEIERDCTTYEKTLEKIQIAAESVIESYNE